MPASLRRMGQLEKFRFLNTALVREEALETEPDYVLNGFALAAFLGELFGPVVIDRRQLEMHGG